MKELSIEEKAKAYDNALESIKKLYSKGSRVVVSKEEFEIIFPELAESEDERIRKELIQFIKNWKDPNNIGRPHDFPTLTRNVEQCDRYIAWLEKQKEFVSADFDDVWDTADCDELTAPLEKYSKDAIKEMCHAWYDKGIELERKSWLEKQGEQKQDPCEHCNDKCLNCHNFPCITKREFERDKSALEAIKEEKVDNVNKVEPKFHEGDWVVQGYNILKIKCVGNTHYCFETVGGYVNDMPVSEIDSSYHLWTIDDARNGDVLMFEGYYNSIVLFQGAGINGVGRINYHCKCDLGNYSFNIQGDTACMGTVQQDGNKYRPATKEQRDILFSKMHEAGYEWDADKKELKEIKNSPILSNSSNTGKQWTDDDEQYLLVCKNALRKYQVSDKWDADIISKWLEDKLKQGEQKPAEWSEEDESVLRDIKTAVASYWYEDTENVILDWLKSLKQRMEGKV